MKKFSNFIAITVIVVFIISFNCTSSTKKCSDLYWIKGKVVEVRPTVTENNLLLSINKTPIKVILTNGEVRYKIIYNEIDFFIGQTIYQKCHTIDGITYYSDIRNHANISIVEENTLKKIRQETKFIREYKG